MTKLLLCLAILLGTASMSYAENEINILNYDKQLHVAVLCIDGFKFVMTKEGEIVQLFTVANTVARAIPRRCVNTVVARPSQ